MVGKLQLSKHCADGTFFQLVFWVADYRAIIPEIKRYMQSFATLFINATLNFSLFSELLYLPDKVDSFHKSDYRTKMSYVKNKWDQTMFLLFDNAGNDSLSGGAGNDQLVGNEDR